MKILKEVKGVIGRALLPVAMSFVSHISSHINEEINGENGNFSNIHTKSLWMAKKAFLGFGGSLYLSRVPEVPLSMEVFKPTKLRNLCEAEKL